MSDIATSWDVNNLRGDWVISGGALADGNDLVTAVLISLFSDRRAEAGDTIPDGTSDPRGWWGDMQINGNLDPIGSRLWLLSRRKQEQSTLNDAVTYAKEALQWMITDGVAANITVTANWQAASFLVLNVTIFRKNGTVIPLNFKWAWDQI